jgi:hypothetical protein
MKKFIILGVVLAGVSAIAVGFLCLTNSEEAITLIQEGDSLFTNKEFTKAKQHYQLAGKKLHLLPFSNERQSHLYLKLAVVEIALQGSTEAVTKHVQNALDESPDLLYENLEKTALMFDVKLRDSDMLIFRDLEFKRLLPLSLRKESPLRKSKITILAGSQGKVSIMIIYNHKDLLPDSDSATTTYRSTGNLKGDVIRDMSDMIASIFSFCKVRNSLGHVGSIDIKCKHGVIQSGFGGFPSMPPSFNTRRSSSQRSNRNRAKDMVIYATHTDLSELADAPSFSTEQIKTSWTVTTDKFPTLRITGH